MVPHRGASASPLFIAVALTPYLLYKRQNQSFYLTNVSLNILLHSGLDGAAARGGPSRLVHSSAGGLPQQGRAEGVRLGGLQGRRLRRGGLALRGEVPGRSGPHDAQ